MPRWKLDSDSHTIDEVEKQRKTERKKPRHYKVLLHNDDYTPMDFVVDILKTFFAKSEAEAHHIMLMVHHKGLGVAGVYPKEIAETKVYQVCSLAERERHPLRCTMEVE